MSKTKAERQKLYKTRHPEIIRERVRNWHRKNGPRIRLQVLGLLGAIKCNKCDFNDWRALQVDHVNGDGFKDRKKGKRGGGRYTLMKSIKENPSKYQILCANCNWIKKYEHGENTKRT